MTTLNAWPPWAHCHPDAQPRDRREASAQPPAYDRLTPINHGDHREAPNPAHPHNRLTATMTHPHTPHPWSPWGERAATRVRPPHPDQPPRSPWGTQPRPPTQPPHRDHDAVAAVHATWTIHSGRCQPDRRRRPAHRRVLWRGAGGV